MLTHQTLLGAGQSLKLLVLVGLTIRVSGVLLALQNSLSSGPSSVLQPGWCMEFERYSRRAPWRASMSRTSRDRLLSAAAGAAVTLAALWLALITAAAATVILRA